MCRCGRMTCPRDYYTACPDRTFSTNVFDAFCHAFAVTDGRSRCTVRTRRVIVTISCSSLRRRHNTCVGIVVGDSWPGVVRYAQIFETHYAFRYDFCLSLSKPPNYRFVGMRYKNRIISEHSERATMPVWVALSRHPPKRTIYVQSRVWAFGRTGRRYHLGIFYYTRLHVCHYVVMNEKNLRVRKKNQTNINIFKS